MKGVGNLDKIQIKNIRSLKDTGQVALSPITLLVGENSSGKSTFLRLFPLIKQSISKRTDGPLLWAGDVDDYVDFGSFAETITNDGSTDMTLCFSFLIPGHGNYLTYGETRIARFLPNFVELMERLPKEIDVQYSITISQSNGHEYISRLKIQLNQSQFEFVLPSAGRWKGSNNATILVDTEPFSYYSDEEKEPPLRYGFGAEFAISEIFGYILPSRSGIIDKLLREFLDDIPDDIYEDDFALRHFRDYPINLMRLIGQYLCRGATWDEVRSLLTSEERSELDIAGKMLQGLVRRLRDFDEKHIQKLLPAFKLLFFYNFFSNIEEYLKTYFRQVHYIAPLRATAERYYRLRNLAIDEVDYQGKNLAMFLSGLSEVRMRKFQRWTQEYFGFRVIVAKNGGHLSVKIALTTGGDPVNMSDTGFGYSQILPIITQLWDLSTKRQPRHEKVPLVIAIEQPELHLHPALQARLAKALLSSIQLAKENGYHLQLIIETHSETIVNYFGMAIANGALQKQDVSVVLFDKDLQTKHTRVQGSSYDQDGYLQNWPVGFFAPKEW